MVFLRLNIEKNEKIQNEMKSIIKRELDLCIDFP